MTAGVAAKVHAVNRFFRAYAAHDLLGMRAVLCENVEFTIAGRDMLSGIDRGIAAVAMRFTQLIECGFQLDPVAVEAEDDHVVGIHLWSAPLDATGMPWALVWHVNAEGKVDAILATVIRPEPEPAVVGSVLMKQVLR